MKKLVFIIFISLLYSCIDRQSPEPPELTVLPDSMINISSINSVSYKVEAFANEDLVDFSVESDPNFLIFDSTFNAFTHYFDYNINVNINDNLQGLSEDSIITLTFQIRDSYNTSTETRQLKVVNDYPEIKIDSGQMCYNKDSAFFYNFEYKTGYTFAEIEDYKFDLVLLYDDDLGYIFASPSAFYISQKLDEFNYQYNSSNRRNTKLAQINTIFDEITAKNLYNLNVSEEYINDNQGNGVGVNDLLTGSMLSFELDNGLKGILIITFINESAKKVYFKYKIQKYTIN